MSETNENNLTPKLRFPQFVNNGDWKVKRLGQTYFFISTNSFSRDDLNYVNGKVKNIHYGDIHTKFSTLFDISKENVPFINNSIPLNKFKEENYCKEGDMIFADASEDLKDIGKSIEIVKLNNEKLLSGLHTLLARQIDSKIVTGFGGYLFSNEIIRKQIQRESQGAKVLGISATRLSNINIFYPKDKPEQQKIADCLSSLDEIIAAENQKLEVLKEHKKGLLQNLFPQEGETVPKLRFKEFEDSGDWEEKSLEKFCLNISSGKDQNSIDGKYKLYGSTGVIGKVENSSYDGDFILVARVGANAGLLNKVKGKFGVTDNTLVIDLTKKNLINFIFYTLENVGLNKLVFGSGQPLITGGQLKSLLLSIPSSEKEQQKISETLSSLDDLINAQSQKVETLKLHKKGLLQGLFPKIDD